MSSESVVPESRTDCPDTAQPITTRLASGPKPSGAIVMGGDYRALALVRSLGRKNVPAYVINQRDQRLAGMSRYARRTLFYPSWEGDAGLNFLLEIADKYELNGWLLFPTSDDSVRLVSSHYDLLAQRFQVTVPPWEELRWAVDKKCMHMMADSVGVHHPRTLYPHNREEVASLDTLVFPVLIKPTTRDRFNRLTAAKAWRVDNHVSLLSRYDEACGLLPPNNIMIQELVPGGGESQFSVAAVCENGRILASLVARRTRQYPMDFGRASTLVETVEDPGVFEPTRRFLEAICYTGLVEVEFKRDSRTGQFKLLDVNPRVWGWFSLCEGAGINFGFLLWQIYQGQPVPTLSAKAGVKWVRMSTDLFASIGEIIAGRLSVRDYLSLFRGPKVSGVFATDDCVPGLLEIPMLLYLVGKRLFRGKGI